MKKIALISLAIITLVLGTIFIYSRINISIEGEYGVKKGEITKAGTGESTDDTTGPILDVKYSNNDKWTNEDVTVTITSSEEIDKAVNGTEVFDENITFESKYYNESELPDGIMAHGIIKPTDASSNSSMPLIVWLHGDAQADNISVDMFWERSHLFPKVIRESSLQKFNAYVLCPHSKYNLWWRIIK